MSNTELKGKEIRNEEPVKVIPLGGLEQIGMNMTAIVFRDSMIVVDCGMSFPDDDMLGIDMVIPDFTFIRQNSDRLKGVFITHGHEDHIGALPFFLKEFHVPVYGTKLTLGIIEGKLEEHGIAQNCDLRVVRYGDVIRAGDFSIEFIRTNHSIADAAALAIKSPAGVIVHTGDFKIDYTPVFGDRADLQRFAELGRNGVLALLCDSTNALRPGFTASESTVGRTFETIFAEHTDKRIIIATFASNVDRVQQIINTAYHYGRKVVVDGRSMVNIIGKARELGYLSIPEGTLIDIEMMGNYPPEKLVLITTGSQGESMAALSRMAAAIHKKVSIMPNDLVVFSSNPIPGNEKSVSRVINELSQLGAEVIYQDAHVSGHACQEEIKLMYALTSPRYAVPVHGEFRHRREQAAIARAMGTPKENTFLLQSGDVLELSQTRGEVRGQVAHGSTMIDGLGVGDVGNIVLRDRQNLGEDGIIIIVMTLEKYTNNVLVGPDIISRGFVYIREAENLMDEAQQVVENALYDCLDHHVTDWAKIKNVVKDSLNGFIWKKMKRSPVILPVIMEVE